MVAAYHLIWTGYGHWLPNDPRGSMSHELRCANILPLGEIHFGRKRVQPVSQVIKEFYEAACGILKHELLNFNQKTNRDHRSKLCGSGKNSRIHVLWLCDYARSCASCDS